MLKAVSGRAPRASALAVATTRATVRPRRAQFLSEYGDFPVYLVNRDMRVRRMTTHELFPLAALATARDRPDDSDDARALERRRRAARRRALAARSSMRGDSHDDRLVRRLRGDDDEIAADEAEAARRERERYPAREWSVDMVLEWLRDELGLGEYADEFRRAKVSGAMLLRLDDRDLREVVGLQHPLTRRRVLAGARRLVEAADEPSALDFENVDGYLAQLDKDRIRVVAKLKVAFDRHAKAPIDESVASDVGGSSAAETDDVYGDGFRALRGARAAPSGGSTAAARRGLRRARPRRGRRRARRRVARPAARGGRESWSFVDMVAAYVELFLGDDPDVARAGA